MQSLLTLNLLRLLALSILFVVAQTAGLLHAEIHPFHEHSEECDVYEMLAKPVDHLSVDVAPNFTGLLHHTPIFTFYKAPSFAQLRAFDGRAPPLFSMLLKSI